MRKIVFSSEYLPSELDDHSRFNHWRDLVAESYGSFRLYRSDELPFLMRYKVSPFGSIKVVHREGTVSRVERTSHDIAKDGSDDFHFCLNRGQGLLLVSQRGRDTEVREGAAILLSAAEKGVQRTGRGTNGFQAWSSIVIKRQKLVDLVRNAEDLIAGSIDSMSAEAIHLNRYVGILLSDNASVESAVLDIHIGATLLDLVALALGASRDAAELVNNRGLRAARILEVLQEIRENFSDPAFSAHVVAHKLGLSARYIQDLLQDTGTSFTERVIEFRLQKARELLTNRQNIQMTVSEIALSCGFNEASYFHRCFRRRFGDTPTHWSAGARVL